MDIVAELRAALVKATMFRVNADAAQRAWDSHTGIINPNAPGGGVTEATGVVFATGYDTVSGLTVVPFIFDESPLGGTDTLL